MIDVHFLLFPCSSPSHHAQSEESKSSANVCYLGLTPTQITDPIHISSLPPTKRLYSVPSDKEEKDGQNMLGLVKDALDKIPKAE